MPHLMQISPTKEQSEKLRQILESVHDLDLDNLPSEIKALSPYFNDWSSNEFRTKRAMKIRNGRVSIPGVGKVAILHPPNDGKVKGSVVNAGEAWAIEVKSQKISRAFATHSLTDVQIISTEGKWDDFQGKRNSQFDALYAKISKIQEEAEQLSTEDGVAHIRASGLHYSVTRAMVATLKRKTKKNLKFETIEFAGKFIVKDDIIDLPELGKIDIKAQMMSPLKKRGKKINGSFKVKLHRRINYFNGQSWVVWEIVLQKAA